MIYASDNPSTGDLYFSIRAKDEGNETGSDRIVANTMGMTYYIKLERTSPTNVILTDFSDAAKIMHLPNSPVTFEIPSTIEGLTTIQHGSIVRGQIERKLTGSIDNLCMIQNNILSLKELKNTPKEIVKIVDIMGREVGFEPNRVLFYIYSDGSSEKIFVVD